MPMPLSLLYAVGKVGLNVAGVGLVGDIAEVARQVWKLLPSVSKERRDSAAGVIEADDEAYGRDVAVVVKNVAGDRPEAVRASLTTALKRVQVLLRQAQRRPEDPSGRSVRPGLVLDRPEDLIPFLTPLLQQNQPPRFQAGDRPLTGLDWVLVEPLGSGGFGEVWKARHIRDHEELVVFKFFFDPLACKRFAEHEAKVCALVKKEGHHPGIVALLETYVSADPPCLRYEYVAGGDLGGLIQDWHSQGKKPVPEQVAKAIRAIALPVAFAHQIRPEPIVHRDLKPANILVRRSNGKIVFKITDFGIGGIATARAVQAARDVMPPGEFMTTALRGSCTPLYASPEQLDNVNHIDPRDDVHALGVIWFQMMTGDLTKGRPSGKAWKDRFIAQGMSAALVDLLESCFEDEEDRPADAGVLVEKLTKLLEPRGPVRKPVAVAPTPPRKGVIVAGVSLCVVFLFWGLIHGSRTGLFNFKEEEATLTPVAPGEKAKPETEIKAAESSLPLPSAPVPSANNWTNSVGMTMVPIQPGSFTMGGNRFEDEKPPHRVRITKPFFLSAHEVTQGQYRAVMGPHENGFTGSDDLPVEQVSYTEAVAFCEKLGKKENRVYRLPFEAEWEYACRAGSDKEYPFGDDAASLGEYAWFGDPIGKTHPVGRKKPNRWGLYDMLGNVYEWCQDGYDANYYKSLPQNAPTDDPPGPSEFPSRVFRGGCWFFGPVYCRPATRDARAPEDRYNALGFRLAAVQSGQ